MKKALTLAAAAAVLVFGSMAVLQPDSLVPLSPGEKAAGPMQVASPAQDRVPEDVLPSGSDTVQRERLAVPSDAGDLVTPKGRVVDAEMCVPLAGCILGLSGWDRDDPRGAVAISEHGGSICVHDREPPETHRLLAATG